MKIISTKPRARTRLVSTFYHVPLKTIKMRHTAEKLFAKICSARDGCINLIMKAFEDVAVDFAWEILEAFRCGTGTTRAELRLSFDDYSKGRRIIQYPHYKSQTEIVMDSM